MRQSPSRSRLTSSVEARGSSSLQRMSGVFSGESAAARGDRQANEISSVFNDFGKDFACVDATGEQPQTGMVVSVEEVSYVRYLLLKMRAHPCTGRGGHGDTFGRDTARTRGW